MPALGGWAASANALDPNAWILFSILFLWQHPHFYAIALMCKEDYKKAGFQMLPVIEKESNRTNRQILWHAFLLIPVSLFFVVTGILGEIYFWGASALGFGYLISGIPLLKDTTVDNAKLLLKTSVIYLPALYPTQTDLSALLASPPAYEPTKTLLETPEVGFAQA